MKAKLIIILFLCLGFFARAQEYPIGQYYERKPMRAWGYYLFEGFYVSSERVFFLLQKHNPDTLWSYDGFDHNDTIELVVMDKLGKTLNRLDTRMTDSMSDTRRFFPQEYLRGKKGGDGVMAVYWRDVGRDSTGEMQVRPKVEVYGKDGNKKTEWIVDYNSSRHMVHYGANGMVTMMGCCSTVVQFNESGKLISDSVMSSSLNSGAVGLHRVGDSIYAYGSAGINVMDSTGRFLRRIYLNYDYYEPGQARYISTYAGDSALGFKFIAYDSLKADRTYESIAKISFDGRRKWFRVFDGSGPGGIRRVFDLEGMYDGRMAALAYGDDGTQIAIFDRNGNPITIRRFQHKYADEWSYSPRINFYRLEYDANDTTLWLAGTIFNDQKIKEEGDFLGFRSVFVLHLDQYGNPVEEEPNLIVEDVYSSVGAVTSHRLRCYPNPAQDVLHVDWQGEATATRASYQIFTTTGQLVQQGAVRPRAVIPVAALPRGLYLLRMASYNKSYYARFVKQ